MNIPFVSTSEEEDIYYLVLFAPLWWLAGLSLIAFQVIVFCAFLKLLFNERGLLRVPRETYFLLWFVASYALSILINANFSDMSRVFASLYNLANWLIGALVILIVYRRYTPAFWRRLKQAAFANLLFILVVYLFAVIVMADYESVSFASAASYFFDFSGMPRLVQDSTSVSILEADYLSDGVSSRAMILSPYPTAMAGTVLILLAIYGCQEQRMSLKMLVAFIALWLIYETHSRVGLAAALALTLVYLFLRLPTRRSEISIILSAVIGTVLVVILFKSQLIATVDALLSMRQKSTSLRLHTYYLTIQHWLDTDLWFGTGVKPRGDDFNPFGEHSIPLGSHSMWLGAFMKTGLIGGLLVLSFFWQFVADAMRAAFSKRKNEDAETKTMHMLLALILAFMFFLIFEDLDAPQYMSFLFFVCVGAYISVKREVNRIADGS